ncbi:MAG TPA: MBL fold metallo-hydrolase [Kofleriaceae bacterium]|jgi:glyoxylase-like metal-dependent hydrolase (beta-lactamase superfamily II)
MTRIWIAAALAAAACSHSTAVNAPGATAARIEKFQIGPLDAVALQDGGLSLPNNGKAVFTSVPPEDVAALLAAAKLPTDQIDLSIQPLLVHDGSRVLLFDTGIGPKGNGHLMDALHAAGVSPSQVTDIFLSHGHMDHVGGILTATGALAFPNATIHLTVPEWKSMQASADPADAPLIRAMTPKVSTFEPGAVLLPEVTAIDERGHTPGHSSYSIHAGGTELLYTGDVVHHFIISVQRPDWTIQFDKDPTTAQAARRALLTAAAANHTLLYVVHFPFPGIGHVQAQGDAFVWVPK